MRRFAVSVLLAACAAALCATRSAAQQVAVLRAESGETVLVRQEFVQTAGHLGAYDHLRVEVDNRARTRQVLDVSIASVNIDVVASEARIVVEPGATRRAFLAVAACEDYLRIECRLLSTGQVAQRGIMRSSPSGTGWSLLVVAGATSIGDANGWAAALGVEFGTPTLSQALLPESLPPDWWLLSGFDVAVVDGRSPDLDPDRQRVLCDLLRSGCPLVVVHADRLPSGPLAAVAARPGDHRLGLGRLVSLGTDDSAVAPGILPAAVFETVRRRDPNRRSVAGPAPVSMFHRLDIPGLGEIPMRGFLALLVVFAVFVGPINYFLLQRRRRQSMLLWTVPVAGFGTTLLVLVYGLLSEGLSTRAAIATITHLDQRDHVATSLVQRTVYAGFGPSRLTPAPTTMVTSLDGVLGDSSQVVRRREDGSLDGGMVPSRTPTALVSISVLPQRGRLRFRRAGPAAWDILPDPAVVLVAGAGTVLMRDTAGRLFGNESGGDTLQPISPAHALALLESIARRVVFPRGVVRTMAATASGEPPLGMVGRVREIVLDRGRVLAPGEYVALVEAPPSFDDLGLDTDTVLQAHLVLGRLAEEDLLD